MNIEKGCVHKKRYQTRQAAKVIARAHPEVFGKMKEYRCINCRGYHVGHPGKKGRER